MSFLKNCQNQSSLPPDGVSSFGTLTATELRTSAKETHEEDIGDKTGKYLADVK